MARSYIVVRLGLFLWLGGPFEYPRWADNSQMAAVLPQSKAFQLAEFLGGCECLPVQ